MIHGTATFDNSGNILTINQGTDRLILGWNSFSIASGETTRFVQPGVTSMALNRVFGGTRSMIEGRLEANGGVILVNPDGITVTKSGVVNVNSFIGSTHDVTDAAFLGGGDLRFQGSSGETVENYGTIHAETGDIVLIARNVRNEGTLESPRGVVGLAAGSEVLYQPASDERLLIKSSGASRGTVQHSGVIRAAAAEIKAAGNPYAVAINLDGVVEAHGSKSSGINPSVTVKADQGNLFVKSQEGIVARDESCGGRVVLQTLGNLEVGGTVLATSLSGEGGGIQLIGDAIHLDSTAVLDVTGFTGGGTILVGGDFQGGANPDIHFAFSPMRNASSLAVDPGARLSADATGSGNGGVVIQWSDGITTTAGSVSARGGESSGNGGFAEISGKQQLGFEGHVDLGSANGRGGTALLDPSDVLILNSVENPAGHNYNASIFLAGTLDQSFTQGTTVSIVAGNSLRIGGTYAYYTTDYDAADVQHSSPRETLHQVGGIAAITLSPGLNLQISAPTVTLQADSSITSSGNGFVQLSASQDLNLAGTIHSDTGFIELHAQNGNLNFFAGSSVSQNSGGITAWSDYGSILGSTHLSSTSGSINIASYSYDPSTGAGKIDLSGMIETGLSGLSSGGSIHLDAPNSLAFNGVLKSVGGTVGLSGDHGITLGGSVADTAVSTANNSVTLSAPSITLNGTTVAATNGSIWVNNGDMMILTSDTMATVSASSGSIFDKLSASSLHLQAGSVFLSDPNGNNPSSIALKPNQSLSITASSGDITFPSGASITASGNGLIHLVAFDDANVGGVIHSDTGGIEINARNGLVNFSSGSAITQNSGGINVWTDYGSIRGTSRISSTSGWVNLGAYSYGAISGAGAIDFSGEITSGAAGSVSGGVNLDAANSLKFNGTLNSFGGDIIMSGARGITLGRSDLTTTVSTSKSLQLAAPQLSFVNNPVLSASSLTGSFGLLSSSSLRLISSSPVTKVYDGTAMATLPAGNFAISGLTSGYSSTTLSASGSFVSPNVQGSNGIAVDSVLLQFGAPGDTIAGSFVLDVKNLTVPGAITPAPVTASLTGTASKVYDTAASATLSAANYLLGGIYGNDQVMLNNPVSGLYDTANAGIGKSVSVTGLSISGSSASNYRLQSTSIIGFIGTINPATLTPSLTGKSSKVYDGTTTASLVPANYSLIGILGKDQVVLNNPPSGTFDTSDVGTSKSVTITGLSLSGSSAANYRLQSTSINGSIGQITQATLTATLTGTSTKVYDTTTGATLIPANYSLSGILGNDHVALNNPASGTFDTAVVGSGKAVTVTGLQLLGESASNYKLLSTSISGPVGEITQATLTASLTGKSGKVYDTTTAATLSAANYSVSGVLGKDQVFLNNPVAGSYDTPGVGSSKTVSVNGLAISGNSSSNYKLQATTINGTIGTITQATLTASLTGKSTKVYDTTTAASLSPGNYNLSGILGNDQVVLNNPSSGSYDTANAGNSKTLNVTGLLLSGDASSNYKLQSTSISGSIGQITQATLTASLTGKSTKVYDTTTTAPLTSANYNLSGILGNDQVVLNNPLSGSYDTAGVGDAKTVTASGLSISGRAASNYKLLSTSINDTIGQVTQASVTATLTGKSSKVYDTTAGASLSPNNYLLGGVLGNDQVVLNNPSTGTYDTANAGTGKSVAVTGLLLSGADSSNYRLVSTSINGSIGTITQAMVTASLAGKSTKVYDTTPAATLIPGNYNLSGVLGNDQIFLNNPVSGVYDTANAGTAKTVIVSGLSISGNTASNYRLQSMSINGPIGEITQAPITVSLTGKSTKVYDTTTAATLIPGNYNLSGVLGNDQIFLNTPPSGSYDNADAGTAKTVSAGGLSISGRSLANYKLVSTTINGPIGEIIPAPLTATLTGKSSKVYDTTTSATLAAQNYNLSGILGSDQVLLNNPASGSYDNANAGTAKTVSVGELLLSGDAAFNYRLVSTTINGPIGEISPAPLTASLTGKSTKVYDTTAIATLTPGSYNLSGILGNDQVLLNNPYLGNYDNANVGITKTVTVNGLAISGQSSPNYRLVSTSINGPIGEISPAPLTASLTGKSTKVYDTTIVAPLSSTNYILSGILGRDQVFLNNPATGTYDTANVGKNKTVSVEGLLLSGDSSSNYQLVSTSITGSIGKITQASLTVTLTGSTTKVYDGTTSAALTDANYLMSGLLGNDVIGLNNPAMGNYDSPDPGSVNVTVGGLKLFNNSLGNYKLVSTTVTAPIGSITAALTDSSVQTATQSLTSSARNSSPGSSASSETASSGDPTASTSESNGETSQKSSATTGGGTGKSGTTSTGATAATSGTARPSANLAATQVMNATHINSPMVSASVGASEFQRLNPFAESNEGGIAGESGGGGSVGVNGGSVGAGSASGGRASSPLQSPGMAAMAPLNDLSAIMMVF